MLAYDRDRHPERYAPPRRRRSFTRGGEVSPSSAATVAGDDYASLVAHPMVHIASPEAAAFWFGVQ